LRVPAIAESGYHRMQIEDREIVLAVAPAHCRAIEDVVPDARLWGLTAQVYALKTDGDYGIGDAAGVVALAESAARQGADALALSPVHAVFGTDPARYGPYAPSSRLFYNPLHAAPALVFGADFVAEAMASAGLEAANGAAAPGDLIDWPASASAKQAVLHALFDAFLDGPAWDGALGADFARYRADGGEALFQHACFEALHAAHSTVGDWRRWPSDLRNPRSAAVAAFAASREDVLLFHTFVQWVTVRSLSAAQLRARQAGMRIGLIGDLAVGIDPTGSQAWSQQDDLLLGLTIGAPPDLMNRRGQAWGLASFSPHALEARGYAPFIATLRAAMRNVGGIRIDHAMGLARLWLVPEGATPAEGAYLSYPLQDLLRLLALESVRHGAIVLGEDLGTVPAGYHDVLEQAGVHGMRVLWFERNSNGGFNPPRGWDRSAVAMTSTHDLPTVAGWWSGTDIVARTEHGQLGLGMTPEAMQQQRSADRPALWNALVSEHVAEGLPPPTDDPKPVVDAALRFVARTESPLCLIPLEDLLAQQEQPNLPGSVDDYPNWRRRLPVPAEVALEQADVVSRVAAVAAERPRQ